MAADAVLVGQLAVKVRPDTSKFADELKKDVVKLERTLKVELPVVPDADQLKKDLKALVKLVNARSKAGTSGYQIKLDVDLNTAGLQDRLRELVRELGLTPAVDIDTDPAEHALEDLEDKAEETRRSVAQPFTIDTKQMLADLERATDRIDRELDEAGRKREIKIEVQAKLDRAKLDRELNALGHELSKEYDLRIGTEGAERALRNLGSKYDDLSDHMKDVLAIDWLEPYEAIKLGFDESDQRAFKHFIDKYDGENIELIADVDKKWAQAQLIVLTRNRIVDLVVRVKESSIAKAQAILAALSGYRLLDSTAENLRRMFENIDKNIPIVGTMALAVQGLSAWLLASASNGFALAQSLAQMFQASLILPGLLAGMAIGAGAMFAVLKDFNSVLPEVGKKFTDLQDEMSSLFWALAKGPASDLINGLFPKLEAGLKTTSVALGAWFSVLSTGLQKHLGKSMTTMFHNLNASIFIATGGVDDAARSIEILGRRGSEYLPRLATWFKDINKQFADWLQSADESGKLTDWIEEGIVEIQEFGRALNGAGSILAGFARAAHEAGGSTLTMLADKLQSIARIVNDEPFQSNLVNVFEAAHQAMDVISRKSGPALSAMMDTLSKTIAGGLREAGSAIGELVRGVSEALNQPAFNSGFLLLFQGLRQGIESLAPLWGPLGDGLGAIGSLIGTLASNYFPLLGQLLALVAELVANVGPEIESVIVTLSGLLGSLLSSFGPSIIAIIGWFIELAAGIADNVVSLTLLAAAFTTIKVLSAWSAITAFFGILPTAIGLATLAVRTFIATLGPLKIAALTIGAISTALVGVGHVIGGATETATPAVSKFTRAIENAYGATSILSTSALQVFSPVRELDLLFQSDAGSGWATGVGKAATGAEKGANEITGLGHALSLASSNDFDSFMWKVEDAIGASGDVAGKAKDLIHNYDQALAGLVRSGSVDAAAQAAKRFGDEAERQGLTVQQTEALLSEYTLAAEEYEYAQSLMKVAAIQTGRALVTYQETLDSVSRISPALIASINETSKGFIDLKYGVDNSGESIDHWLDRLEEMVTAQAKWADNMTALAARGVSEGVLAELDRMGVEGAPLVAKLVNASDEELGRLDEIVRLKMGGAREQVGTAFAGMSDDVTTALEGLPDDVKAELDALGIVAFDAAGRVADQIGDGLSVDAKSALENMTPEIKAELQAAGVVAFDEGGRVAGQVAGGIASGIDGVDTAAGAVAGAAVDALGGVKVTDAAFVNGQFIPQQFVDGVNGGVEDAEEAGGNLVAGVNEGVGDAADSAATAGAELGKAMAVAFKEEMGIQSPSRVFKAFGGFIVAGLSNGVDENAGTATTSITGIATGITTAFTSALGLTGAGSAVMRAFGVQIPTGLAGGIGARVGDVVGAMDNVEGKVDISGPGAILDPAGRAIVRGFGDAIRQAVHFAADAMVALRGILTISNPAGVLSGAGRTVIEGFVSGLQAGFSRVRSTLNTLTSLLPDWKGPAKTDKTILVNAGQLVIDGFIDGLTSRFGAVRDTLSDLTDEVGATEFAPLSVGAVASTSDLQGRVSAGMDGAGAGRGSGRTLNYYAAPGSSLGSEEDLWAASDRARMVGW